MRPVGLRAFQFLQVRRFETASLAREGSMALFSTVPLPRSTCLSTIQQKSTLSQVYLSPENMPFKANQLRHYYTTQYTLSSLSTAAEMGRNFSSGTPQTSNIPSRILRLLICIHSAKHMSTSGLRCVPYQANNKTIRLIYVYTYAFAWICMSTHFFSPLSSQLFNNTCYSPTLPSSDMLVTKRPWNQNTQVA